MTRAFFRLANPQVRARAHQAIDDAPEGARVEIKDPQRTNDQNAKMWAMLTDVSVQHRHGGRHYDPDDWKVLFLMALGKELRLAPSLTGTGFVPLGTSSSKLSKGQMSDLIEFMYCFGAENGIVWSDPKIADESRLPARRAA